MFEDAGYNVTYKLLKASDYGIAQDRERVFFVGMKNVKFKFNTIISTPKTLRNVIYDIKDTVVKSNGWLRNENTVINSHEYLAEETNGYSSQFMSRNRVRTWDEFGYTVVSSARHVTLHPGCPVMTKVQKDLFRFEPGYDYRRLSVRECARIQSFPDSFKLEYTRINNGYKMIGNAVPPELALVVANNIRTTYEILSSNKKLISIEK